MKNLFWGVVVLSAGFASAIPVSSPDGKVVCDFNTPAGVPTVTVR